MTDYKYNNRVCLIFYLEASFPSMLFISQATFLFSRTEHFLEMTKETETCCSIIPCISTTWLCDLGAKMDTLAKSPEAFPFDGRRHGNIQRFVRHGVLGRKLIIRSALWLCWSQDIRQQASFSPLFQLMELTHLQKWEFNWFFQLCFLSGIELAACEELQDRTRKRNGKKLLELRAYSFQPWQTD